MAGKVALVTGAARNIGRAIAMDLARGGARVAVHANVSGEAAAETVRLIEAEGGTAVRVAGDVTDPAAVERMVGDALGAFGRLDILVNSAALRRETAFERLSYAEWREVVGVILDGAFLCAQAAVPALKAAGGGAIVNLGGMSAHTGTTERAHVVAAKMGVVGLTRALAFDLAGDGITANCVVPGLIDTQRGESGKGSASLERQRVPLAGRRGRAEEVAGMVRYLVGPGGRYVTGQTVHVNGGAYLG